MAYAPPPLSDPAGSSTLVAAVQWLQGTLLGTIATTIAIIAVAATGMMMLAGRIDVKRGIGVVIGCFIIFAAPSIAAGLQSYVGGDEGPTYAPPLYTPAPLAPPTSPRDPVPYDPYAGAAVPSD